MTSFINICRYLDFKLGKTEQKQGNMASPAVERCFKRSARREFLRFCSFLFRCDLYMDLLHICGTIRFQVQVLTFTKITWKNTLKANVYVQTTYEQEKDRAVS